MRRARLKNKFKQKLSGWPWASGDVNNPSDSEGNMSSSTADPNQQSRSHVGQVSLPERHRSNAPPTSPQGPPPSQPVPTKASATQICQLWKTAYENLREEDEGLIADYEAELCGSLAAGLASTISSKLDIRDRMATILQHKMDEVNKDTWRLKFGSSEVQVKDLVQPILGVINSANEYIANAASANPCASLAWAGVSFLLPLFLNPTDQGASLSEGLEYISTLIAQSRMWEDLYARRYESKMPQHEPSLPSHTAYRDALEKLYRQILKFQTVSYCYYSRHAAFRLGLDMIKWNEWDTMMGEIRDRERMFADLRDIWRDMKYDEECEKLDSRHQETTQHWQAIGADVSGLRKAIEDAQAETKRGELLRWLCTSDHSEMYNAARDLHESGTGDWLVRDSQAFKTWKKYPGSLLWLHGKPGSGKSILSSSVVRHLQDQCAADPETAMAYFFFSFSDSKKQSVAGMLASLVKQLCASRPDTPERVKSLSEYKDKGGRPETRTLEAALLATVCGFSAVFIVVDALDECPILTRERTKLLSSLGRIVAAMPGNLHILCTSRPEADIKAAMDAILSPPRRVAVDLTADREGLNQDIGLYIDTMLASTNYSLWPNKLKADAKALLIEKADGMFLYVSQQLEALKDLASDSAIRAALQNFPAGLDATYDRILQGLNQGFRAQVTSALKWLASSNRALWLEELAEIFILRPDRAVPINDAERLVKPEAILKYVSSLVVLQDTWRGPSVRLSHFSVKEYLTSARVAEDPAKQFYSFNEVDAHLHIARSCLAYHLHRSAANEDEARGLCLRHYVSSNWALHLEMVPRTLWPAEVVDAAARALGIHSNSLRLTIHRTRETFDRLILLREVSTMLQSPQCFTARRGFLQLTEMLLCGGPGVNNKCLTHENLDVALPDAVRGGSKAVVQLLLDRGAHVNARGGKYETALQAACANGRDGKHIVPLLLERGADVNIQGGMYGNALQAACLHQPSLDTIKLLLARDADVKAPGGLYGSAISAAAVMHVNGHGIIELLIRSGADANQQGGECGNALQAACAAEEIDNVRALLDHGADINAVGGEYGTALQAACVGSGI
ncbi:hypothetical protein MAPG_11652, partial [Magnaporthiopsis poae ATCC 64411]